MLIRKVARAVRGAETDVPEGRGPSPRRRSPMHSSNGTGTVPGYASLEEKAGLDGLRCRISPVWPLPNRVSAGLRPAEDRDPSPQAPLPGTICNRRCTNYRPSPPGAPHPRRLPRRQHVRSGPAHPKRSLGECRRRSTFARHDLQRAGKAVPVEHRSLRLKRRRLSGRNGEASPGATTPDEPGTSKEMPREQARERHKVVCAAVMSP